MPIYEYQCRECGTNFEKLVRTPGSENAVKCPYCRSERVQKKMSVCGFLGSGSSSAGDMSAPSSCAPSGGG